MKVHTVVSGVWVGSVGVQGGLGVSVEASGGLWRSEEVCKAAPIPCTGSVCKSRFSGAHIAVIWVPLGDGGVSGGPQPRSRP